MREFGERGGWWVVGQAALLGAVVVTGWRRPVPFAASGWARMARLALGGGALALGAAGALAAMSNLGRSLTPYPVPTVAGTLARRGAYRFARHPIYGGVLVMSIGFGLVRGDLGAVVVALGLAPFFIAKASFEERHLLERYPEYAHYQREVRHRLIPGLF